MVLGSLRNLIRLCRFSKKEKDDQQFPVQQVEYLGKVVDVFIIMPYGSHANIPEDFLGVLAQVSGQEQNRIVIPTSAKERIHPVESGEVVYFHPVTKSKVHFKNNGDIDIETEADINATCANLNAVVTTKATVTAPESEFIGNVTVNGNLAVTGSTTLSSIVTSNGKNISDTHTHSQGVDSAANTQQDTDGVV